MSTLTLQQVEAELAELEEVQMWLDPSMTEEYSELGWREGDDELVERIDEFDRRRQELEERIIALRAALDRLRSKRRGR